MIIVINLYLKYITWENLLYFRGRCCLWCIMFWSAVCFWLAFNSQSSHMFNLLATFISAFHQPLLVCSSSKQNVTSHCQQMSWIFKLWERSTFKIGINKKGKWAIHFPFLTYRLIVSAKWCRSGRLLTQCPFGLRRCVPHLQPASLWRHGLRCVV